MEKLFKNLEIYNDHTLARAEEHAHNLNANLGGTSLMEPLQAVLSLNPDPMFPHQVFLLVLVLFLLLLLLLLLLLTRPTNQDRRQGGQHQQGH